VEGGKEGERVEGRKEGKKKEGMKERNKKERKKEKCRERKEFIKSLGYPISTESPNITSSVGHWSYYTIQEKMLVLQEKYRLWQSHRPSFKYRLCHLLRV
jgi:hypothetical protein